MDDIKKTKAQLLDELADLRRKVQQLESTEKSVQTNEEKYLTLLNNIEDGYYEVDLSGKFSLINPNFCKFLGLTPEELIGHSFRNFISIPESAEKIFNIFNEIFRTGIPVKKFEYQIIHKDGDIRDLELSASLILDAEGRAVGFRGISRDITTAKEMEAERERYRDFVENITDGCIESDLAGNTTFVNEAACQIFGYTREELIGWNNRNRITPETAKRIFKVFNEIYRTGIPARRFDYPVIRKNGEIGNLEVSGSLIRDQAGKPKGFRGVIRDITERKKMEAEQERSREFVENINDGCWETDLAGNITFANEAIGRIYGYSREEFIGMNNRAYTTPETAKRIYKMFNEIFQTGQPAKMFDYEIIRKDGEIILLEVSATLINDQAGKSIGFRGVSRDITERKKMEVEQERYRDFVENIADGCWELDLAGNVTFINEATCRVIQYSRDELLGMNNRAYTTPATSKKLFKVFNEIFRTGLPAYISDYPVIRKDGGTTVLELSASLIRDEAGNPVGFRGITRDITERKKMEAEQERYRDFFENIADGVWEVDLAGNMTLFNEAACRMFGYPREELPGLNNRAYTSPETAKNTYKMFNEIYRTGLPAKIFEYEVIHQDGTVGTLELSASLIRDHAGNPVGFRGITRDITERKKIELEQERFRDFFENIAESCYEQDLAGNYTFVNEASSRIFGYTREELLKINFRDLTTPETAERIFTIFSQVFKNGNSSGLIDIEMFRKDKQVLYIETMATLIRDSKGTPLGFRGIARDITERKKMEREQERFREFVETIEDGCYEQDLAGNYTFVNDASCRIYGYTREELLKMNFRDMTSPETAKKLFPIFNQVYKTGIPTGLIDIEIFGRDKEVRYIQTMASLIRDANGKPFGFRGVSRDLSERKRMEAETAHLTEQLNQARKLEAVGTLAGGIAHDFNNLLMGIQGYTSLMLLDTDTSHPFYEKLKAIEAQVRSAADLTKQLLGYARGGRYEVRATNLNELSGKTASLFGRTKKEITIHQTFAKDLWTIEADQGQLEHVLLNLFMNAWQAMPGGGTLYLQTENVLLDESYVEPYGTAPGPFVKLSVTDTGVGMDRETKERIFEPFFTTKEMGRGTGLGLASTYGIIRGHKGIITVYSEKGYGTTFNIYLPSSQKEVIQPILPARKIIKAQETLLLVDDEKTIIEVTGGMITRLGYQLLIAHSGEEAVEIYQANPDRIDLVIMDMIMPGIGGGAAFDLIKSFNPQVKVILSSGFSLNGEAKEILNRGARLFLQKPFRFDNLSRIIKKVLEAP